MTATISSDKRLQLTIERGQRIIEDLLPRLSAAQLERLMLTKNEVEFLTELTEAAIEIYG